MSYSTSQPSRWRANNIPVWTLWSSPSAATAKPEAAETGISRSFLRMSVGYGGPARATGSRARKLWRSGRLTVRAAQGCVQVEVAESRRWRHEWLRMGGIISDGPGTPSPPTWSQVGLGLRDSDSSSDHHDGCLTGPAAQDRAWQWPTGPRPSRVTVSMT